jgi:hypothetical protein
VSVPFEQLRDDAPLDIRDLPDFRHAPAVDAIPRTALLA